MGRDDIPPLAAAPRRAAPLRAAARRAGRVRPVRGARRGRVRRPPARHRRGGAPTAVRRHVAGDAAATGQRSPASQALPTRSSVRSACGEQVGDQALELAADQRDLHLDVARRRSRWCRRRSADEARSCRRARRACRGSRPSGWRRRPPSTPRAGRSGSRRRRTSSRTTGCRSAGWVWSTTTFMPVAGRRRCVTSWRVRVHRRAHLLAEGRVGQHREHVGGGGVVGHLVRELHGGVIMPLPVAGSDDDSGTRQRRGAGSGASTPRSQFGEQGAQLTYGSYLQLAAAARRPAPRVRPAGARRAAVHHHPPGLRAVVPAAAARGDRGPRRDAATRPRLWWAQHLLQRMHVIERVLVAAGRRARDDDAAGLPRSSGSRWRRPAASSRCSSASWSSSPAPRTRRSSSGSAALTDDERARLQRRLDEPTPVGRVPRGARRPRAAGRTTTRRSPTRCDAWRTTGRRTPTSGRSPRRCSSTTSSPRPGGPGTW